MNVTVGQSLSVPLTENQSSQWIQVRAGQGLTSAGRGLAEHLCGGTSGMALDWWATPM